jgi:hypothetical protein
MLKGFEADARDTSFRVQADEEMLPWRDETFDLVASNLALHWVRAAGTGNNARPMDSNCSRRRCHRPHDTSVEPRTCNSNIKRAMKMHPQQIAKLCQRELGHVFFYFVLRSLARAFLEQGLTAKPRVVHLRTLFMT